MTQYKQAFFEETDKCLGILRENLNDLKSTPEEQQEKKLFEVMRMFHSIKSAAAMMGYLPVAKDAMAMERIYSKLIEIKASVPEVFDSALEVVGKIEIMIKDIKADKLQPSE